MNRTSDLMTPSGFANPRIPPYPLPPDEPGFGVYNDPAPEVELGARAGAQPRGNVFHWTGAAGKRRIALLMRRRRYDDAPHPASAIVS